MSIVETVPVNQPENAAMVLSTLLGLKTGGQAMKKTLTGPFGLTLILDKSQVMPEDPGSATPAIVELKGRTATYWCAQSEGKVEDVQLSPAQRQWLDSVEDELHKFLFE